MSEALSLRVRMFGGLAVEGPGGRVAFDARQTGSILARLALEPGREIGREGLACGLWPDLPADEGRARLRQRLYILGKQLEEVAGRSVLHAERDAVRLDEAVETDLARFQGLIDAVRLREAADLADGELLPGFEGDAFLAARSRAADRLWGALRELARSLPPSEALPHARRLVALDPYSEEAACLTVRLLVRLGRVQEARAAYEALAASLAEIGEAPGEDARAALERTHVSVPESAPEPDPSGPGAEPKPLAATERTASRRGHEGIPRLRDRRWIPSLLGIAALGGAWAVGTGLLASPPLPAKPPAPLDVTLTVSGSDANGGRLPHRYWNMADYPPDGTWKAWVSLGGALDGPFANGPGWRRASRPILLRPGANTLTVFASHNFDFPPTRGEPPGYSLSLFRPGVAAPLASVHAPVWSGGARPTFRPVMPSRTTDYQGTGHAGPGAGTLVVRVGGRTLQVVDFWGAGTALFRKDRGGAEAARPDGRLDNVLRLVVRCLPAALEIDGPGLGREVGTGPFTLRGHAPAGHEVAVLVDGRPATVARTGSDGRWACTLGLGPGRHLVRVRDARIGQDDAVAVFARRK